MSSRLGTRATWTLYWAGMDAKYFWDVLSNIFVFRGASDTGSGGGHGSKAGAGAGGLFENIKEKAKSVTKRNFLN